MAWIQLNKQPCPGFSTWLWSSSTVPSTPGSCVCSPSLCPTASPAPSSRRSVSSGRLQCHTCAKQTLPRGKTWDNQSWGPEFDPLIPQLKMLNWHIYYIFTWKMSICISVLKWARYRTWFVMCSGCSNMLNNGPFSQTQNMNAPIPNGNFQMCSLITVNTYNFCTL